MRRYSVPRRSGDSWRPVTGSISAEPNEPESTNGSRRRCRVMGKTRPTTVAIGERRRPDTQGRPGYLRLDTVHQPEQDGEKSVYHINAVDAVTQWEGLGCVPKISEHYLAPALEAMLEQF